MNGAMWISVKKPCSRGRRSGEGDELYNPPRWVAPKNIANHENPKAQLEYICSWLYCNMLGTTKASEMRPVYRC